MVGDHFEDMWKGKPWIVPYKPQGTFPIPFNPSDPGPSQIDLSRITREEFEALKKEVQIMRGLLERALAYDKANGEPHCEKPEKIKLLKEIAKAMGVELPNGF
jgi:hypothetical protein